MGIYKDILVGFDGSENSLKAARRACELARLHGASVHLATVVPPSTVILGELMTPEVLDTSPLAEAARERLREVASSLSEEYGVQVSYEVYQGDPGEVLLDLLESGYDLIIVGRRSLSRLERMLMGSVARKVVERSSRDVLVVP
ncbi:MAG: universal stress protein [Desulfurococcales archaeon]|nr:universal stress protein [Desulfurococcales archaeon]MCE4604962.1 universal stress protein [Desulfurococcales archaeon]